jgi:hypothetical protein
VVSVIVCLAIASVSDVFMFHPTAGAMARKPASSALSRLRLTAP